MAMRAQSQHRIKAIKTKRAKVVTGALTAMRRGT
jgi:hypothetical protein